MKVRPDQVFYNPFSNSNNAANEKSLVQSLVPGASGKPGGKEKKKNGDGDGAGENRRPTNRQAGREVPSFSAIPSWMKANMVGTGGRAMEAAAKDWPYVKFIYYLVEKLAMFSSCDKVEGSEQYDPLKVALRTLVRKPLYLEDTKFEYKKRDIVVILDRSPSCSHFAKVFDKLLYACKVHPYCTVYTAFNGNDLIRKDMNGDVPFREHGILDMAQFKDKVIINFCDLDAVNYVRAASKHNDLYYFACNDQERGSDEGSRQAKTMVNVIKAHGATLPPIPMYLPKVETAKLEFMRVMKKLS